MSAAGPRAALALKTRGALMSGDMGIAPTAAGGQAQRAAADVGATSVGWLVAKGEQQETNAGTFPPITK